MSSTDSPLTAYLDGKPVSFRVDSHQAISLCPSGLFHGLPSHVCCCYRDGFTYAAVTTLQPSNVGCLVLGRDWLNAERVARLCEFLFFVLLSFLTRLFQQIKCLPHRVNLLPL